MCPFSVAGRERQTNKLTSSSRAKSREWPLGQHLHFLQIPEICSLLPGQGQLLSLLLSCPLPPGDSCLWPFAPHRDTELKLGCVIRVLHGEPVSPLPSLGYRLPGSKLGLTLGGTFSTGEEQDFLCHGSGTRRGGQGVPLCTGPITSSAYRAVATFVPPGSGVGAGVEALSQQADSPLSG